MAAKIHVEADYHFVCIFDDILSNFVFARTMKNLEFYWQGQQNQRSRLLRTRCDFRQLFSSKTTHLGSILDPKAIKKHAGKQGSIFLRPWGAFGVPLGPFWATRRSGPGSREVRGGTMEPQAVHFCSLAPTLLLNKKTRKQEMIYLSRKQEKSRI